MKFNITMLCQYTECHYPEVSHFIYAYADCYNYECPYAECPYAECPYAECPYAECPYAECH
jgi:hypothetical protein